MVNYGAIAAAYLILNSEETSMSPNGTKEPKDTVKETDWKTISNSNQNELPRKIRQIPSCCILPRRSLSSVIAFYGVCIIILPGATMLAESWISKKVKEDGGDK